MNEDSCILLTGLTKNKGTEKYNGINQFTSYANFRDEPYILLELLKPYTKHECDSLRPDKLRAQKRIHFHLTLNLFKNKSTNKNNLFIGKPLRQILECIKSISEMDSPF